MLNIVCCTVGTLGTCCYVLSQDEQADCVVIDPGAEAERIRQACDGRHIAAILLTHGHFDHIGAVEALMGTGTELVVHQADAPMLQDSHLHAGWLVGQEITCPQPTRLVQEGDVLDYAGISLTVLHTPGHTPGSVCYQAGSHLFTGDTLFAHGFGRTDLPGGSARSLYASLQRLMPMQRDHSIYPGHGS